MQNPNPHHTAVKAIALYEAAKGLLALCSAWALWHYQHDLPQLTTWLAHDLHRLFGSFLSTQIDKLVALEQEAARDLPKVLALLAGYALLRFAEGYGLYANRRWAYWLSLAGYGLFIPLELNTLLHRPFSMIHLLVFLFNLLVMWVVYRNMRK